jgi:TRAP-type C4-dicarboxylate transport system permease small subunit
MQSFLDGKRTWIGLAITVAGIFGVSKYISSEELTNILNVVFTLLGLIVTAYGNYKAQTKITMNLKFHSNNT